MAREYRTRIFKSGNSVALRLPKALGITEGMEFEIVPDEEGRLLVRPVPTEQATLAELFGSFSEDFMPDGRMSVDEIERNWPDAPPHKAA